MPISDREYKKRENRRKELGRMVYEKVMQILRDNEGQFFTFFEMLQAVESDRDLMGKLESDFYFANAKPGEGFDLKDFVGAALDDLTAEGKAVRRTQGKSGNYWTASF